MTSALVGARGNTGLVIGVGLVSLVAASVAVLLNPVVAIAILFGVAGVIAIVEAPAVGAVAIAAFAILRLSGVATEYYGAPSTFTPLLALIMLALVARNIRNGETFTGGGRALVAFAALGAVATFSLISTPNLDAGVAGLTDLAKDGAIAVIIGMLLQSSVTLRQLVWVMIGGGMFLSALSILQFLTDAYGTSFGGFAQSRLQHVVATTDEVRVSGPIGDPNFYAQWLVMLVPLAIDRFHDENSFILRWTAAGAAVMSSAVIVITFSRGALLALFVVVGAMAMRNPPKRSTLGALAVIGVLAVPFLPPGYVDRMVALTEIGGIDIGTDPSLRAREAEFAVATQMFLDDPLTGIGYNNFQSSYVEYARGLGVEQVSKAREAHNLYLETAAETGIPGLVVLGGVATAIALSLAAGRRRFRAMGNHRADGIGHSVGVALIGYLVTSIFLHMAYVRPVFVLIGVALTYPALAGAEDRSRDNSLVGTP